MRRALLLILALAVFGCSSAHQPPTAAPAPKVALAVQPAVLALASTVHVDVRGELTATIAKVCLELDCPSTTVTLQVNAKQAIPEVGVGGFTDPSSGKVVISIAPSSPVGLKATLTSWLDLTAAHELDHAVRILSGPGYGTSLLDTMVSEGLADDFSADLTGPPTRWEPTW